MVVQADPSFHHSGQVFHIGLVDVSLLWCPLAVGGGGRYFIFDGPCEVGHLLKKPCEKQA